MEDAQPAGAPAGDVHPGLGRPAVLPRRPGARRATAATNMDTLVAIGTTAAWALQRGRDAVARARPPGRARARRPTSTPRRSSSGSSCSGAGSRPARRAAPTGAIRRLVGLQADDRPPSSRDGGRGGRPARASVGPATCCASGRARRSRSTASSSRAPRRSTSRCSPASRCRSTKRAGDEVIGATLNATGIVRHARDAGRPRHGAGADRRPGRSAPRARRRRSSASPTGSPRSSSRSCSSLAALTFVGWFVARPGAAPDARPHRVHRRARSSPARARWAWRRRRRSWSAPAGAPRPGSSSAAARRSRPPTDRHRRLRQDRHADPGPAGGRRDRARRPASTSGDVLDLAGVARARQRAPARRRRSSRRAASRSSGSAGRQASRRSPGAASRDASTGVARCSSAAGACWRDEGSSSTRLSDAAARRGVATAQRRPYVARRRRRPSALHRDRGPGQAGVGRGGPRPARGRARRLAAHR